MRLLSRTAVAGLLTLGLSVPATAALAVDEPAPVPPAPSEGLPETAKGRCVAAVDRRTKHLELWSAQLMARNNLQPDQKAALVGQLQAVSEALTTVARPAVVAATNRVQLRTACRSVVNDYRVYVVVHPRTFITAASQGWLNRVSELEGKAAALAAAGKDTSAALAQLAAARQLLEPIPAAMADITPASYNASPALAKATFTKARTDIDLARLHVRAAAKLLNKLAKT